MRVCTGLIARCILACIHSARAGGTLTGASRALRSTSPGHLRMALQTVGDQLQTVVYVVVHVTSPSPMSQNPKR